MTDDKDFKRLVRARMAKTGESYTTARAKLRPPAPSVPATVDGFKREIYTRAATERLGSHLESTYGIEVDDLTELDLGVFHVTRTDGPDWVARVFPAARGMDLVEGDAEILRALEQRGFPAERCAHPDAVTTLEGQGVLVTEHVPGDVQRNADIHMQHRLGDLLGRLHTLPVDGAMARPGGAWHHVGVRGGGRSEDVRTLKPLLADARKRLASSEHGAYDSLCEALDGLDVGEDLPHAFVHPQFSGADVVSSPTGPVVIDWAGAGRGPRLESLAILIDAGQQPHPGVPAVTGSIETIDAIIAGYRPHVRLETEEVSRLGSAMQTFGLILDCWYFLIQDVPPTQIVKRWPSRRARAEAAAARAVAAFDADDEALRAWDPDRPQPPVHHEDQGTLW